MQRHHASAGASSFFPGRSEYVRLASRPQNPYQVAIEECLTERLQEAKAAFASFTVQFKRIIDANALRMKSNRKHGFQPTEEHVSVKESLIILREAIVQYPQALENLNNFHSVRSTTRTSGAYIFERSPTEERQG
jgi:hypothetical protein